MTVTISENYLSRPFKNGYTNSGRELIFDLQGSLDETEIEAAIWAAAPASYLGLALDGVEADPVDDGIWKGKAIYTRPQSEQEFDSSPEKQKITQSLGTIHAYGPDGVTPPDYGGVIGVTDDKVEGVEIQIPNWTFSETHIWDAANVTIAYQNAIYQLSGSMNNAPFKGYAAGEVLFLGAQGKQKGTERWTITYKFQCSPNFTGLTIGTITGIDKLGWDYLWIRYQQHEDTTAGAIIPKASAVYIERVYPAKDFSLLLIGV